MKRLTWNEVLAAPDEPGVVQCDDDPCVGCLVSDMTFHNRLLARGEYSANHTIRRMFALFCVLAERGE